MKRLISGLGVWQQFMLSLAGAVTTCIGLLLLGDYTTVNSNYHYLIWNLFLAALPLAFAGRLSAVLKYKVWSAWEPIGWSLLWLLFLPNSFYMISDYIHLREVSSADILFHSVLFTSFIYLGVLLGYCSMYLVHNELRRRLNGAVSAGWMAGIIFVCSTAIYIGRDLRWNSWDVLVSPAGLLFDVTERLLHPSEYPDMILTIVVFFALLSSLYAVFWSGTKLLRRA